MELKEAIKETYDDMINGLTSPLIKCLVIWTTLGMITLFVAMEAYKATNDLLLAIILQVSLVGVWMFGLNVYLKMRD